MGNFVSLVICLSVDYSFFTPYGPLPSYSDQQTAVISLTLSTITVAVPDFCRANFAIAPSVSTIFDGASTKLVWGHAPHWL